MADTTPAANGTQDAAKAKPGPKPASQKPITAEQLKGILSATLKQLYKPELVDAALEVAMGNIVAAETAAGDASGAKSRRKRKADGEPKEKRKMNEYNLFTSIASKLVRRSHQLHGNHNFTAAIKVWGRLSDAQKEEFKREYDGLAQQMKDASEGPSGKVDDATFDKLVHDWERSHGLKDFEKKYMKNVGEVVAALEATAAANGAAAAAKPAEPAAAAAAAPPAKAATPKKDADGEEHKKKKHKHGEEKSEKKKEKGEKDDGEKEKKSEKKKKKDKKKEKKGEKKGSESE